MIGDPAPDGSPNGAGSPTPLTRVEQIRLELRNRGTRLVLLGRASLLPTALLIGAKAALVLAAPSWFLFGSVAVSAGLLAAKARLLLVAGPGRGRRSQPEVRVARTSRCVSLALIFFGLICGLTGIPASLDAERVASSPLGVGIALAAISFTELIACGIGMVVGRRDAQPFAADLRRVNLASGLVLLTLAQVALLSATGASHPAGPGLLGLAVAVAIGMLGANGLTRTASIRRRPARGGVRPT
ncbi:hypothetical protein [Agromyces seonyuensis]|uniref:Uncharacterized protein n=1 Tax=Agromyces seonyuensis TaxID=2662446 RepID=A0A6I4P2S7_9MICO|nr:hypothetical protein [Agromyces seonyuensis]MWB97534.1 hypothetical protein [Agromyces seonyuensis]